MVVLINATLAGGAAIGGAADLINYPYCSMIVGFIAGSLAALGFTMTTDFIRRVLKIHDS